MVALVVFGLFALMNLETDELPEIEQPVLVVVVPYPGGAPESVEQEVLEPIEEAASGISGVDDLYGTAGDGFASDVVVRAAYVCLGELLVQCTSEQIERERE